MWPTTPSELIAAQRELAGARGTPWRPRVRRPLVAACFVCFGRGRSGPVEGAWAAAALMHGDRHLLAVALVRGEAGYAYEPGLLALREGPASTTSGS